MKSPNDMTEAERLRIVEAAIRLVAEQGTALPSSLENIEAVLDEIRDPHKALDERLRDAYGSSGVDNFEARLRAVYAEGLKDVLEFTTAQNTREWLRRRIEALK